MASRKQPPGELDLIERIRLRAARLPNAAEVTLGIGDDCAVVQPRAGEEILITTDFSVEGRHFRRDWHPPASIGHRALARGLSDLAAMGARPVAAFLSLALPRAVAANARWVNRFVDGMLALAKDHGITLTGGDTSESPTEHVLADIMLLGAAPSGTALRRSGARPGDVLYCTGTLGGSAQELVQLGLSPESYRNVKRGEDLFPHLYPEPRVAMGMALRERGIATACIDLSDGLSTDLAHLCTASGVAAEVVINALPAARRLRGAEANFSNRCVHHGGEDYELLFTARAETKVPKKIAGVKITRIGNIIARTPTSPQMVFTGKDGFRAPLIPGGWEHFSA